MEPKKPALSGKSRSEKKSGPWRPTKRRALWVIGMVVALLTTALLIVNLHPEIWKSLFDERNLTLIAIGLSVTAIIVLLAIGGASLGWTGFGDKTFWDWLQLLSALAIPVVLAAAGLWFTAQQDARQQNIEDRRAEEAQKIENQRAAAERELAEQRAQDEALQAYLDQMSQLMLERKLLEAEPGDPVHTLAQARTSTVILRLDAEHNESVTRFLSNSGLAVKSDPSPRLLREIALENATLSGAYLPNADLGDAFLRNADLSDADLSGADLDGAFLRKANLRADLGEADLSDADLGDAFLSGAWLLRADLSDASLYKADLSDAVLEEADLSNAYLSKVDLSDALLIRADLRNADLSEAVLDNANLRDADLSGARQITNEQIERQTKNLKGATMPNGQRYEDWLKEPRQLHTTKFEPALSYNTSAGWRLRYEATNGLFFEGPDGGNLIFTSPSHVFDPSSASEPTRVPAPENAEEWVSWFQRHPSLVISEPVSVRMGGLSGKQIDVAASSTRPVLLYLSPYVSIYAVPSDERWKGRYVIVDVGGETVVINYSAPKDEADTFFQKAQKLFDTVEWKSE